MDNTGVQVVWSGSCDCVTEDALPVNVPRTELVDKGLVVGCQCLHVWLDVRLGVQVKLTADGQTTDR